MRVNHRQVVPRGSEVWIQRHGLFKRIGGSGGTSGFARLGHGHKPLAVKVERVIRVELRRVIEMFLRLVQIVSLQQQEPEALLRLGERGFVHQGFVQLVLARLRSFRAGPGNPPCALRFPPR